MNTDLQGVIPSGMVLRGSIVGEGDLIVAGRIEGEIDLEGCLELAAGGSLQAEIRVRRAVVGGFVEGNLQASEVLELLGGSRVEGDLRAPRLVIADGAIVRGRVELGGGEESAGSALPNPAEAGNRELGEAAASAAVARGAAEVSLEPAAAVDGSERMAGPSPEGKPSLPPSALAFGDRRKVIVPNREE